MKIRVINPNTTLSMTDKISRAARAVAAPGTDVSAVSPQSGASSIEDRVAGAIAALGICDEVKRGETEGVDGYIIACFGDPGVDMAREIARGPVIGMAEAAMRTAAVLGQGFSIVSMLERGRPILRGLVDGYGMTTRCRSIRLTGYSALELETGNAARNAVIESARLAVLEDGADTILLGCGGMADLVEEVEAAAGVPAIDGVACGVKILEGLIALGMKTSKRGGYALPLQRKYAGPLASYAVGQ